MIRQMAAATGQPAQMLRALNRSRFNKPPDIGSAIIVEQIQIKLDIFYLNIFQSRIQKLMKNLLDTRQRLKVCQMSLWHFLFCRHFLKKLITLEFIATSIERLWSPTFTLRKVLPVFHIPTYWAKY